MSVETYRQDIGECVDRLNGMTFRGSSNLKELPKQLHDGEGVRAVLIGSSDGLNGALVLTDERVLWAAGISPIDVVDEFPYHAITGISVHGLLPPVLTLEGTGLSSWEETVGESEQMVGKKHIFEVNRMDAKSFCEQVKHAIPTIN